MTGIFLASYRGGERQFALQRSAHKLSQDLRTAQEKAMSSEKFNNTFPKGGYGIYLKENSNSYILFADCNDNGEYDESGAAINCAESANNNPYPEKIQDLFLESQISITSLSPAKNHELFITFFPPDPIIDFSPSNASLAEVVLGFNGQTLTVILNKLGLIEMHR